MDKAMQDKAIQALRQLEWSVYGSSMMSCPICMSGYKYGHAPHCNLADVLIANGDRVKVQKTP